MFTNVTRPQDGPKILMCFHKAISTSFTPQISGLPPLITLGQKLHL